MAGQQQSVLAHLRRIIVSCSCKLRRSAPDGEITHFAWSQKGRRLGRSTSVGNTTTLQRRGPDRRKMLQRRTIGGSERRVQRALSQQLVDPTLLKPYVRDARAYLCASQERVRGYHPTRGSAARIERKIGSGGGQDAQVVSCQRVDPP
jgi:hypothetical protein